MLKTKNYCINSENLLAHELIGLNARVIKSTDPSRIGLKGKVVGETKNLIILETKKDEKKIPKKECVFVFDLIKEKVIVEGNKLVEKPENRIKLFWRKKAWKNVKTKNVQCMGK